MDDQRMDDQLKLWCVEWYEGTSNKQDISGCSMHRTSLEANEYIRAVSMKRFMTQYKLPILKSVPKHLFYLVAYCGDLKSSLTYNELVSMKVNYSNTCDYSYTSPEPNEIDIVFGYNKYSTTCTIAHVLEWLEENDVEFKIVYPRADLTTKWFLRFPNKEIADLCYLRFK